MLSAWLAINADGTATVFTGKVELGQGILTALVADRGRGARSAARAGHDHFRRHRPHAERRPDRRQPVGREQRHGAAAWRAPKCARSCSSSPPRSSALRADTLKVADGIITAPDGRKVELRRARRRGRTSSARRPARSRRSRRRSTDLVGQSIAARRPARQGDRRRCLRAGPAAAGHGARPRGAAAAIWRAARSVRRSQGARRCRASSRWCATAASSASSPSARSRRSRRSRRCRPRRNGRPDRRCPIPRASTSS